MSTRPNLESLDLGLSQNREYESKKDEVEKQVRQFFVAKKVADPSDKDMQHHFIQRFFSKANLDLSNMGMHKRNALEEAFYDLVGLALFCRFRQKTDDANASFSKANQIATYLKDQFMLDHYNFALVLDADPLKKKLKSDRCYELVNQTLAVDKDKGIELIATGLNLAIEIGDEKRRLDFLSKCQYVLYELESLQHDAMSLGHYILSSAGGYETLKAWTKFHIGNIWLDFENPPNARDQFEEAMDWALNTGFPYAVMTFYERLALANMRLGKLSLAEKYYEESQKQAKENDIKPELVMKNDIRCKIGLGNLRYRKAESELGDPKESACQAADQYFKQALTLIAQTNYPANRKVSLVNLSELYKLWRGPNDPDAKNYLDLANQ